MAKVVSVDMQIARGGFGIVERVSMDDGTHLARKTFSPVGQPPNSSDWNKLRSRFEREVKVQSSLNSSSFIPIVEADLNGPNPWYLMPLADKNLMEQIVMDRASGSVCEAALADLLNALEELHELGFVHRDLKPQNVLLYDGKWRLTDFGLVLPVNSATTKLTSTDSAWGTQTYCAPEQALAFRTAGTAADIYAFGCILHDMFVHSPRIPYARQTGPGEIGAIIEKCTEQKADRRFQSVKALRSTLLSLLATPTAILASPQADDWAGNLAAAATWTPERVEALARFLANDANASDKSVIFQALDDEALEAVHSISPFAWKEIALEFCDWVAGGSFAFVYCDLLITRIEKVFVIGDLECKSLAAVSAVKLACRHNRWFVMGYIVKLCGHALDEDAARRIAIEITAASAGIDFARCAVVGGKKLDDFHPRIGAVLPAYP